MEVATTTTVAEHLSRASEMTVLPSANGVKDLLLEASEGMALLLAVSGEMEHPLVDNGGTAVLLLMDLVGMVQRLAANEETVALLLAVNDGMVLHSLVRGGMVRRLLDHRKMERPLVDKEAMVGHSEDRGRMGTIFTATIGKGAVPSPRKEAEIFAAKEIIFAGTGRRE
jgi:hypothetical protein